MKKVIIIMNETHSMMEEQKNILEERFGEVEMLLVPATGWKLEEIDKAIDALIGNTIVFVSPIPYMIQKLSFISGYAHEDNCSLANGPIVGNNTKVLVFHNDHREKKELPNGKIIQVVAETGWQLV